MILIIFSEGDHTLFFYLVKINLSLYKAMQNSDYAGRGNHDLGH